jgi:ankyrin repeat protein
MKREIAQINDNPEIQIEEHAAKRLKSDLSEIKFLDASGLEIKELIEKNDPELIAQKFDTLEKLFTLYKVDIPGDFCFDSINVLHIIAYIGSTGAISKLLDRHLGTEVINSRTDDLVNASPLMVSALKGHKEVVAILLDRGADIEAKDETDWTPLIYAARNGHKEVVELLLDRGANIESEDEYRRTPLSYAADEGYKEVVAILLDRGANTELASFEHGETPLMVAIWKAHEEIVELLLDRGANIETKDVHGWTPLMLAASYKQINAFEILMKSGANIDCKLPNGKTLSSFATERGHTEIVKLIETYKLAKNAAEKKCDITTTQEAINTDKIEIDKFIDFLNFFIEKTGSIYAKALIEENNISFRDVADLIWKYSLSKQYKELKTEKLYSLIAISTCLEVFKDSDATIEQSKLLSELPEALKEYITNPESLVKAYFVKDSTLPSINFIQPSAMNEIEWQMFCESLQGLLLPKELKQSTNEYIAECNAIINDPKTKAINESHLIMIERLEQVEALKSKNEELEKKILEHDIIMKEAATLAKENHELRGKVGVIEKQYSELFSVLGKLLAGKNQEANSDFKALEDLFPQSTETDQKPMDIIGDSSLNHS